MDDYMIQFVNSRGDGCYVFVQEDSEGTLHLTLLSFISTGFLTRRPMLPFLPDEIMLTVSCSKDQLHNYLWTWQDW